MNHPPQHPGYAVRPDGPNRPLDFQLTLPSFCRNWIDYHSIQQRPNSIRFTGVIHRKILQDMKIRYLHPPCPISVQPLAQSLSLIHWFLVSLEHVEAARPKNDENEYTNNPTPLHGPILSEAESMRH